VSVVGDRTVATSGSRLGANFWRFWAATSLALFGSAFGLVVFPLVATLALRASATAVGVLAFVELAPYLLFGLFVGVVVDRVPRRSLMAASHLLRALLLATVPLLAALGALTLPALFVIAFVFGTFTLLFEVAHQAFLPALVGRDTLVEANSRLQISRSAAELSGPGLAGPAVQLFTAPGALLVNAVAFMAAGAVLWTVRQREVLVPPAGALWQQVRDGIAFVARHPVLRALAGALSALYFFITAVAPLIIVLAARNLRLSPSAIGLAFACAGVGTVVGAVVNAPLVRWLGVNQVLAWSAVLSGAAPALAALATPASALPMLMAGQLLTATAGTVFAVTQVSARQAVTPDPMQGRMNGTMRFAGIGGRALGSLAAGLLAGVVGVRVTLAVAALGGVLALAFLLASPLARVRRVDELAPAGGGDG
jgi:Transmembrane secretion effector